MASSEMTEHVVELYRSIYAVVRRIPTGHVATYGQVAELAGIPGGGRVAGAAMKTSKPADRLPWQRVIGKAGKNRGRIAIHDPVGAAVQRQLLGDEGVEVGDSGLIALDRYGWLPASSPGRTGRKAGGSRRAGGRSGGRSGGKPGGMPGGMRR
jgi:methylated-DNA-protein-cysteine methyltransferase-like protein